MRKFDTELVRVLPDTARMDANGQLSVGGRPLAELASEFGTPLYIYDVATIRAACAAFRRGLAQYSGEASLIYAAKAYASVALFQLLAQEGLGIDCVSDGELFMAHYAGVPGERLVFHGNNKLESELELALRIGVGRLVVDNRDELELLAAIATAEGKTAAVWLRLNPGVEPHDTHAYRRTGQLDSKFGFPIETGDAERAVSFCQSCSALRLLGYHLHIGSQIFDLAPYREAIERAFAFAARMRDRYGVVPREFSPGGGLGVPYTPDDPMLDLTQAAAMLAEWVQAAARAWNLPLPRLYLEPGRSLVARAGLALYRVGAVKRIPGVRTYVAVDGGMADNIRPALYGARYVVLPGRFTERSAEQVTVVGKYCESGDVLVWEAWLPTPQRGDLVIVPVAGAYCLAMASNYNLARRPAVVAVEDGRVMLWQRRETLTDLIAREMVAAPKVTGIEFSPCP
ncbi:diaminopimelate decarboxylase [Thermomicrobium sp. CFH 73360]|uniref:diaminopimelate decarboxylase n=1 Tax=Thermomicrobium sp. CFH 73360 TaxID=2951987 RepID=UPI0020776D4C|nr:diaminopimelate decarboxylase [Thermomicrobium sp. CFH 73360]MCM8746085.1 diaminopimelate decarboxylase [Thermomicrobium sp. CFH 73360]